MLSIQKQDAEVLAVPVPSVWLGTPARVLASKAAHPPHPTLQVPLGSSNNRLAGGRQKFTASLAWLVLPRPAWPEGPVSVSAQTWNKRGLRTRSAERSLPS